jgi:Nif-specific regulatory protein/two-component system response regulator HydG
MEPYPTLFEIAKLLLAEDLEKTPEILLRRVLEFTGAERGFIVVHDGAGYAERFHVRFERSQLSEPQRRFSRSVVKRVLQTGQPFQSSDLARDPRIEGTESVHALAGTAVLAAPLQHGGEVYGAIYIEQPRRIGEPMQRFLAEFCEVAGLFLRRALEHESVQRQLRELQHGLFAAHDFPGIVTADPKMLRLLRTVAQVADSEASVLVHGESGTGKELVVRALHLNSSRRNRPFVAVHCAALPDTLLESELFGHRKGAFTGAQEKRTGRLPAADGGTLFLDEIAEIAPEVQAKLLRFLQFGEIQRVGSDTVEHVDVRVVAATHQNLQQLVEAGRFRQDLYFRLKVLELRIPPLRERASDIPLLLDHFLRKYWKRPSGPPRWTQEALRALQSYAYPGNVRELEHLVERACLLATEPRLGLELLPPELLDTPPGPATRFVDLSNDELKTARDSAVAQVEREFLAALLERHNGNISKAARAAGFSRPYLQRLLARHADRLPR